MLRPRVLTLSLALGLLGAAPVLTTAQEPVRQQQHQMQRQMLRMQEQIHQLNRSMERMAGIQERARVMERQMVQSMERLHVNREVTEQNALQFRNQERLRTMAQAMGEGAQEMQRAMQGLRDMLGEPGAAMNGDMERDMLRLRQHWEDTAGSMEEGLRIMERLRDRIHQEVPVGER